MDKIKRILTGIIGLPIVAIIFIFGNPYIIDVVISIVAIIAMYEYFKAFKKEYKPVEWIGYLSCILISVINIVPIEYKLQSILIFITILIAMLFIIVIFSKMKIGLKDIAITFLGICYITLFLAFIPLLYGIQNGKFLIWYMFIAAWGTDTFAYIVGMKIGKHKFSKISPKKSVEGCFGGIIGATILMVIYTIFVNKYTGMNIQYWYIGLIGIVLSILSQIGDFAASSIKRTVGIKDFSNLFPGHGGMLDRIDSIIFIAPFTYFLLIIL